MTVHPLDDVRGLQEEFKGDWTVIVREHLNRTLVKTGYVSAEDFDALGIPPEHSNLANAQMGAYSRMGYMEAIAWHRSKKPSRKSGKVWTHKITEKGRQELSKLVGLGGGNAAKSTSPGAVASGNSLQSGEKGGRSRECRDAGNKQGSGVIADPNQRPEPEHLVTPAPAVRPSSPDPLQLPIPESPRLFDYDRPEAA